MKSKHKSDEEVAEILDIYAENREKKKMRLAKINVPTKRGD